MSVALKLLDQADRDRIEQVLDHTLFVEAGAGTGKTRQLVERIVNLIAAGRAQAQQIAAITFTEKAAAELRDRILERLETESDRTDDPERQQRSLDALDQLDHAAIETIHAFAGRILSLYPIEAGLPPGFEIIDDTESGIEFAERWRDELDDMLERPQLQTPLRDALDAGITLEHLGKIADKLHQDWDRAESEASQLRPIRFDPDPLIDGLLEVCERRHDCPDPTDSLYLRLDEIAEFARSLRAVGNDSDESKALLAQDKPSFKVGNSGQKKKWPGDSKAEIIAALRELNETRQALRLALRVRSLPPIYNAIREFVLEYADDRRRRGRLGFHDLLVRCRDLLSNNADVAAQVSERYRYLLIDEFQDTDPLQTEIADAIARGEVGRLFFVGDPKQSIYRFRRADIEQYNRVRERYQHTHVHLTQNFRSQSGVTEFVNAVFGPLMGADQSGGQAAWEDLHATRESRNGSAASAVTVIGDELDAPSPAVRQSEAETLADLIADVRESRWLVLDPDNGDWRPAKYADIAVLVPNRTGLARLLPELEERDIPYRLESRSLIYSTEEVRGLLGILRAIDDPTDEIALVGSLRSPAFACSDADLFSWHEAGGKWDYRAETPAGIGDDHAVAEAMRWLNQASAAQWRKSVSALVEYVIRERRLLELAVVVRRPRDRWQRLRFLLDQARDFCDRGGRTLHEFLAWAQHQADEDTRVIELVVPEPDSDAVRILTIHAAKGLEFPVVVLTGLNVEPKNQRPVLLWNADGTPELRFSKGLETPNYGTRYDREAALEAAERLRRNYVAMTRARDHLVVSVYRKVDENKKSDAHVIGDQLDQLDQLPTSPYASLFRRLMPRPNPLSLPPQGGSVPEGLKDGRQAQERLPETPAEREQWLVEREDAIRTSARLAVESATSIAKRSSPADPNIEKDEPSEDLPPWRRGRAGTSIGRAVHSALQVINIEERDEAQIRTVARAQSAAEGLPARAAAEVTRLIRVALDSASVREAVASDRYWRELYVAAPIAAGDGDEVLVEGFIDLLYETAEGELVVVDYKTDALQDDEAVEAALERYQLQGATYVLALEASLGRSVSACRFLFLHANAERDVSDLAGAVSQVRALVRHSG